MYRGACSCYAGVLADVKEIWLTLQKFGSNLCQRLVDLVQEPDFDATYPRVRLAS